MGKKILLADDSITIQKVIELTFSDEDFDVVTVGNGRLAVEKAQEVRPDIVLCDIIMPEKDGYEVCDFIKKHPALSHVPVLLLTGAFEPFDQERAARVGCDGFLAKPFEPQTLIAKVKDLLSQAASRQPGPAPRPAAPSPSVLAVSPPSPAPVMTAPPIAEPAVTYMPEEPMLEEAPMGFADVMDTPVEEPEATVPDMAFEPPLEPEPAYAAPGPGDELMPISSEEQEALGAPPMVGDSASTVMFQALSSQARPAWNQPTAEVPLEERAEASAQAMVEPAAFEEVFEEEPAAPPPPAPAPPAAVPVPVRPSAPPPTPAPEPAPLARTAPEASFDEVTLPEPAPAARVSEAAEVAVPVEQVAQIAQRVVAQISEKVVREVAWEVIPDLAEALIKKEIERLKAELQQT